MRRKTIKTGLMFGLILVTLLICYRGISLDYVMIILNRSSRVYLLLALAMMLLYWGLESLMLGIIIGDIAPQKNMKALVTLSVRTTLVGQYYSNITPFASGGQPAQLMILNQNQIRSSNGVAALVSKSLVFQVTVTLYALMMSLAHFNYLWAHLSGMKVLLLTGLAINSVGLSVIVVLAFHPKWLKYWANKISRLWQSVRKAKSQGIDDKIHHFIDHYHLAILKLGQNRFKSFCLIVFSVIQITAYFSVSFFIYKALGFSQSSIGLIITLQAVLYVCVSFIPIPGTVGASEVSYLAIMGPIFSPSGVGIAMVIWRLVSYYFGLLFCGLFTFVDYLKRR